MRFKVPQNVDMPDRILGPLTMIQFVEAVLGGGLAYVCQGSLPSPINTFLAVVVLLFTAAIVFVKINERPFLHYLKAFIKFLSTPKRRVWLKDSPDDFEIEIYTPPTKENHVVTAKPRSREEFERIAKEFDSQNVDKIKMR